MLFFGIFLVMLISNWLENLFSIFQYTDKVLVIVLMILCIFKVIYSEKKKKNIVENWMIVSGTIIIILLVIVLVSNVVNDSNATFLLQVYSFFNLIKFPVFFISCRLLFKGTKLFKTIPFMKGIANIFSGTCISLYVVNIESAVMQPFDKRFGIFTYSYGFSHPAVFSMIILLLSIMMACFSIWEKKEIPYRYLLENLFLIITAGRSTAIGFYLCFLMYLVLLPYIKKIRISNLFAIGIFFLVFNWNRILLQFGDDSFEARSFLLRTSVNIAKKYAPFGAGLGLFGSNASRINYSPLYYEYNLSSIWGLSEINPMFITDSYWAMVIGEIGILGVLTIVSLLIMTLATIFELAKGNLRIKILIAMPFVYALTTSFIDSLLVSSSIICIFCMTIYLINISEEYSGN